MSVKQESPGSSSHHPEFHSTKCLQEGGRYRGGHGMDPGSVHTLSTHPAFDYFRHTGNAAHSKMDVGLTWPLQAPRHCGEGGAHSGWAHILGLIESLLVRRAMSGSDRVESPCIAEGPGRSISCPALKAELLLISNIKYSG